MISLTSEDRLLILAPHPDDESLGTGGLIQRALAVGAKLRVLFVTNGDNNPWPQRFIERRLLISVGDRARWGTRRQSEALAALSLLGVGESSAGFLNFPDQGLTGLLMSGRDIGLVDELDSWRPTLIVGPSRDDAHPDHSAVHVLLRFALLASGLSNVRLFDYIVHPLHTSRVVRTHALQLSSDEVAGKLGAILCHKTQIVLSRRRFTAHAQREEWFQRAPTNSTMAAHPTLANMAENEMFRLMMPVRKSLLSEQQILIAGVNADQEPVRCSLTLPRHGATVHLQDGCTGLILGRTTVRYSGRHATITIPLGHLEPAFGFFIKLCRPRWFFDPAGWHEVQVSTQAILPGVERSNPSLLSVTK